MNTTKRRGPRTEPCRTPVSEVSQEEDDESILTKDERFVKYEWIQVWIVPDKPNVCSSLWRRVVWSRVSKAADISRAARIVTFPKSMVSMISLVSLSKAVSVEWNFRYADWRGEKLGEMERWGRRRAKAKRSNILPTVFKLEIGLKFEGSDLESKSQLNPRKSKLNPKQVSSELWASLSWTQESLNWTLSKSQLNLSKSHLNSEQVSAELKKV